MKKILPVILLLCVLATAVGFGVYYHIQTQTKFNDGYVNGNNAGNLYNDGLFCESNGTVFFANPSDVNGPVAIITIPSFAISSMSVISS